MKFDKEKFSEILIKIKDSYGSINKMAEKSDITTAYISKLIRLMYDNAPSPEVLMKIANASNDLTTYEELMFICGYFSHSNLSQHFTNLLKELEKVKANKQNTFQFYMCPVYSNISMNQFNWEKENIEGRIPIPFTNEIHNPEEYFYLKITDESMNKLVKSGSYALIHKQNIVEDGEVALVVVNDSYATLKKFSKQDKFILLEPLLDERYGTKIKTEIYDTNTSIKILGKYIGKFELNM